MQNGVQTRAKMTMRAQAIDKKSEVRGIHRRKTDLMLAPRTGTGIVLELIVKLGSLLDAQE